MICQNNRDGICANFPTITTLKEFPNDGLFKIGAYIAKDEEKNEIVVAFKGTDSLVDMGTNLFKFQTDRYVS
jgi:hypothetical protein